MILYQLEECKEFTNTEKQIAQYVLNQLNEINSLSAENLGKLSFTSKASVIRFCKKLGLSGYEEFKTKLSKEVSEKNRIDLLLKSEPINQDTKIQDIFNVIPTLYQNAINNVNLNINERSFKRIIEYIRKSSCIDIYGMGITYACATTAKFKFRSLGFNCDTYSGLNEHYIMANKKQRNKVAFILSFTGNNTTMIEIAQYLKLNDPNVSIIGIGGKESDNLSRNCDEYIEIISKQLIMSMEVLPPYISITYIFDLLFSALLVANFEKNLEASIDVLNFKNSVLDS